MKVIIDDHTEDIQTVELLRDERDKYYIQMIDQRKLPHELELITTYQMEEAIYWISDMAVRGAPAIGAAGAFALVLGIQSKEQIEPDVITTLSEQIIKARPTAKDLETFVLRLTESVSSLNEYNIREIATRAKNLATESKEECRLIGEHAKSLIQENMGVLTHCNAGALATVDYGTALAPMRFANRDGTRFKVFVDETRPRLQGMLTAWELKQEGIDHEVIVDNAAGFYMQQGKIQLVITGTDRVLKHGTVTNKIGTLEKAVLANTFDIPVYIAMPWTTYDPELDDPADIPIEYRSDSEITHIRAIDGEHQISPDGSGVSNPAFDITPAKFITGYITKDGILTAKELPTYYEKQ